MTATISRNSGRLTVPLTQNTAPVLEFNCLYSHDIRRKQKRWQDGFLKYHTFNKRVMVYDVPRNLIGDTHWLREEELQEGDELKLEKGGALVQVADKIGQTETDLTELRKSRTRETGTSDERSPARPASRRSGLARPSTGVSSLPLNNKSLNAVLGTPRGPIGKAQLPTVSPYEQRYAHVENETWTEGRPPKRQRTEHLLAQAGSRDNGGVKSLRTGESQSQNQAPRHPQTKTQKTSAPDSLQPTRQSPVVNLSSDNEQEERFLQGLSSDAMQPPSSPVEAFEDAFRKTSDSRSTQVWRAQSSQSLAIQPANALTNQVSRRQKGQLASHEENKKGLATKNHSVKRTTGQEFATNTDGRAIRTPTERSSPCREHVDSRAGRTLRMATSAPKKKTLFCQEQAQPLDKAKRTLHHTNRPENDHGMGEKEDVEEETDPVTRVHGKDLAQRLSRIDKKAGSTSRHALDVQKPTAPDQEYDLGSNIGEDDLADLSNFAEAITNSTHTKHDNPDSESKKSPMHNPLNEDHPTASTPQAHVDTSETQPQACLTRTSADEEPTNLCHSRSSSEANATTAASPKPNVANPQLRLPSPTQDIVQAAGNLDGPSKIDSAEPTPQRRAGAASSKPFQAPKLTMKAKDADPPPCAGAWSREAFDLFTWRPPNWDEEGWCVKKGRG